MAVSVSLSAMIAATDDRIIDTLSARVTESVNMGGKVLLTLHCFLHCVVLLF